MPVLSRGRAPATTIGKKFRSRQRPTPWAIALVAVRVNAIFVKKPIARTLMTPIIRDAEIFCRRVPLLLPVGAATGFTAAAGQPIVAPSRS
jgi:hypothetical protein